VVVSVAVVFSPLVIPMAVFKPSVPATGSVHIGESGDPPDVHGHTGESLPHVDRFYNPVFFVVMVMEIVVMTIVVMEMVVAIVMVIITEMAAPPNFPGKYQFDGDIPVHPFVTIFGVGVDQYQ
jgi:hypothetical protein